MPLETQQAEYSFKDGRLTIEHKLYTDTIAMWPVPMAKRSTYDRSLPHAFEPTQRLIVPKKGTRLKREPRSGPERRQAALNELRDSLPDEVALALEQFRSHQWMALLMVRKTAKSDLPPEKWPGVQLLKSNPALGFCLANYHAFADRPAIASMDDIARYASSKRRVAAAFAQFPETEASVKALQKVLPGAITIGRLKGLRSALKKPGLARAIAQMRVVNAGVMELVGNRDLISSLTTQLLREVSEDERNRLRGDTAQLLEDTARMHGMLHPNDPQPRFQSIRRMMIYHDELNARLMSRQKEDILSYKFPPPPVPGNNDIVPITNPHELVEEAREQHHCVATYARDICRGSIYVYRVLKPQRATLSVRRIGRRQWALLQLRCEANRPASEKTHAAVREWFQNAR